jgi:hydroxypyruvate isomerase
MQLVANLTMLFNDLALPDRIAAAAAAGFEVVEVQFPYESTLDDLARAREAAGVEMALINIPLGDREAGDVGLTCLPGRQADYRAAVETCLTYARALGVRRINSLAGRPKPEEFSEARETLIENLRYAAERFAEIGATVLVEPVNPSDVPGYLFNELDTALEAVTAVDRDNVKVLFDFYHMAQTEPSLSDAVRRAGDQIGHVQFADVPGRHEPGSGGVDFEGGLKALKEIGYTGYVSAEYWPANSTAAGLGWMANFRNWMS